jgi:hypothetical protein
MVQFTILFLRSVLQLLVTASLVPTSPILVTLRMKAICSSETSVPIRATRHNITEDGMLHSHRCENLKSYNNESFEIYFKLQMGFYPVVVYMFAHNIKYSYRGHGAIFFISKHYTIQNLRPYT